jgi:hypothetical protein
MDLIERPKIQSLDIFLTLTQSLYLSNQFHDLSDLYLHFDFHFSSLNLDLFTLV